jgi:hypothetical protein
MHLALSRTFFIAGFLTIAALAKGASQTKSELPDPGAVMEKVIQRSREVARADAANKYAYQKYSIEEELDAAGRPTKTTEEIYDVIPIGGVPFERLVKVQGRDLTEKQVKEQDRKEEEFRKKLSEQNAERSTATNNDYLNQEIIDRFAFRIEGRTNLLNRPALILSFQPKPAAPDKKIADKVLKRLAGTLWIDEEESEIAQLKLGLTADLSLGWFGMIGSLKTFDLTLERARLPDGVWVDKKQTLVLGGRKVFSRMHFRAVEESSNFHKP